VSTAAGSLLVLGLEGPRLSAAEEALFRRLQPAGYILFSRNLVTPEQTRDLTDTLRNLSKSQPIIAIDQEGGRVTRTKDLAPEVPSAAALADCAKPALTATAGRLTGELLRLLGVNMNLAPVLDLDHHPGVQNALRGRCWGSDPQRVIDHAGQWNRSLRQRGIATCAKHFPAGGRAVADPHHELPTAAATLDELMREDVLPYTALMPELDAIMLGHIEFPNIDGDFPASLSPRLIRCFLRDQLGFDRHLVVTDDLDMAAITRRYGRGQDARLAIAAGNDLALICHRIDTAATAAAAIAELPGPLLADAWERVERLRDKLHRPLPWSPSQWQATCAALATFAATVPAEPKPAAGHELPLSPVADY